MQLRLMQGVFLNKRGHKSFFFNESSSQYSVSRFSLFAFLPNISIVYKYFNVWLGDL